MDVPHGIRISRVLGLALWLVLVSHQTARSLPPGRAWAPTSELRISGATAYAATGTPRFDYDSLGVPWMLISTLWDTSSVYRWSLQTWRDTSWVTRLASDQRSSGFPEFAVRRGPERTLVQFAVQQQTALPAWISITDLTPTSIGSADSVFETTAQSTEYAAAASARRRWVARSEQRFPEEQFHIRVFCSDTARIWHEVERQGVDEDHCTLAPLGDTTAILAYAGESGLGWAILDGTRWIDGGNLDPRPLNAGHPRFRFRPSGGLWLFWSDHGWMHMSTFRDGIWDRGDSVRCIPNEGDVYWPGYLDAAHDTTEYPLVVWGNFGAGTTYRDAGAIAFPNGHGWDAGEEIPGSEGIYTTPTVTRDLNGDVWVAWRTLRTFINRWTHTYCSATCAAPSIAPLGDGTRVIWALSSRAPSSRWTVFRAEGDGALFDSLGTVRAGEDSVLAFDDSTAYPGQTWRYRVRRESVDIRYRWESDVATHWRPDTRAPIGLAFANPSGSRLTFRLSGAAGLMWARLYDLQGRVVLQERLGANGTGDDTFTLDLGASGARRPGIYFLRVTDGTRRTTRTARVAVVR